jgi:hypothetical protein
LNFQPSLNSQFRRVAIDFRPQILAFENPRELNYRNIGFSDRLATFSRVKNKKHKNL